MLKLQLGHSRLYLKLKLVGKIDVERIFFVLERLLISSML